jgi:S1-C subfamily serine protease
MLSVDIIAIALIAGMAALGARTGLAGVLPLAGFAAGAVAGALLAPLLLHDGADAEFALVFALPGALLLGALLAAAVERRTPRLRRRLGRRARADTAGGAILAGCVGAVAAWLLGAGLVQVDALRDPIGDSTVVGGLNALLPPPGPKPPPRRPFDPLPVVAGRGPAIPAADPRLTTDPQVRIADRSVVRIGVITACGGGSGSGWIAADGVVVTNAHVVHAADALSVRVRGSGPPHPARTIWFDQANDLALLRVPALRGVPALPIVRRPRAGTPGAELGFPHGRHAIRAARIGPTTTRERGLMGGDLGPRSVTTFRGNPEPGSSGGPVVDSRGRVLTTVFALGTGTYGGFGVPNRFVSAALRGAGPPVDTGSCGAHGR